MAMERLFQLMKDKGASDMFISVNSPIHLKINGQLIPVNAQRMDQNAIHALLGEIVTPEQLKELKSTNELNMGIPAPGIGRFRLSAFTQRGSTSAVLRFVPFDIPNLTQLHIPTIVSELVMEKRGLLLVVGATGSGKSTTIAAMLDERNRVATGHILTLEDPIEFLFTNKRSIVNQREIGTDAANMTVALKNALRQAPDCIMIGEIRDRETMAAAIAYAQSGHLVVATLHANNTYQALTRIINFFPLETRQSLLSDLAVTLKAIVSQRLIKAIDGGRRVAVEVMLNTRHVSELIEQGEIVHIREAVEKSLSPGSQTYEQALMAMISEGVITQEEGLANADSATNLYWMINNQQVQQAQEEETPPPREESATFTEFTLNM
jgi:twitching motility protein PilU